MARELLAARERAPSSTDALLAGDAERWRRARALLDELGRIDEELKQTLESAAVRWGTARARALAEARGLVDEALARTREVRVEPPTRSRHTAAPSSGGARVDVLTPRQREVLQRVVLGQSTRAIAEQLAISVKTVETHRAQIWSGSTSTTSRHSCSSRCGAALSLRAPEVPRMTREVTHPEARPDARL